MSTFSRLRVGDAGQPAATVTGTVATVLTATPIASMSGIIAADVERFTMPFDGIVTMLVIDAGATGGTNPTFNVGAGSDVDGLVLNQASDGGHGLITPNGALAGAVQTKGTSITVGGGTGTDGTGGTVTIQLIIQPTDTKLV